MMPFEKEIKDAAGKYQIPFDLLYAQVKQESNFNPLAVSSCGARGLMQLMPETGQELGLKEHEFFDVELNLDAGARYLRSRYRAIINLITTGPYHNACTGDDYWKLALACYNGGLGYVIKAINICKQEGLSIRWETVEIYLSSSLCVVKGKKPDYKQIKNYVLKIWTDYKSAKEKEVSNV